MFAEPLHCYDFQLITKSGTEKRVVYIVNSRSRGSPMKAMIDVNPLFFLESQTVAVDDVK